MFNEQFWLAIAFAIFVAAFVKYALPTIISSLDSKSKQIADNFAKAQYARQQAEKLLVEAQECYKEAQLAAKKILSDAENQVQKLYQSSQEELEDEIKRRTDATIDRIKTEEENSIRKIKTRIVLSVIGSVEKSISSQKQEIKDIGAVFGKIEKTIQ